MLQPQYYQPVFIHIVLLMVLCSWMWLHNSDSARIIEEKRNPWAGWLLALLFTICVGLRPLSGVFVDTMNYVHRYILYQNGMEVDIASESDWLFSLFMCQSSKIMNVQIFFLLVEIFYVAPMIIACKRWFSNNQTLALLFCFTALSFFSYGTNGIRNGMATSIVILALSYINGNSRDKIIAAICAIIAVSIHKSTSLPLLIMVVSLFYRNTKVIMGIWLFSIFLSLTIGGYVEQIFAGLGFDDRLDGYINNDNYTSKGFRLDFLLYSMMPTVLGYYTVIKKKVSDDNYLMLLHTYILSNAVWVMLIRAAFSNRFAYLSWFLYPLVLAYPLLKLDIWGDSQGRKCAYILLGHVTFTYLMWLRG